MNLDERKGSLPEGDIGGDIGIWIGRGGARHLAPRPAPTPSYRRLAPWLAAAALAAIVALLALSGGVG